MVKGETALHIAVKNGNKDIIKHLIKYQGDLNKRNFKKETPLDLCKDQTDIKELLQFALSNPRSKVRVQNNIGKTYFDLQGKQGKCQSWNITRKN